MQTSKANLVWGTLLFLIFLRPFLCQMCYLRVDIYYSLVFISCAFLWLILNPKVSSRKLPSAITLMCNFRSGICYILSYTIKNSLNYPILLLLIALVISTLFSINIHLSLKEIYKFIPYLVVFYLMTQVTIKQKRQVLITLVIAGSLLGLYGIYQFFWGFQNILNYLSQTKPYPYAQEFLARKRVFATFVSPDIFAGYLIMIIPLAAGLFLDSAAKKNRSLYLLTGLSIPFMFVSLLLTKSIGGWLSLFVGFLVFSVLLFISYPLLRRKILLATVISCILITSILAGIFIIRAAHFFDLSNPQNSIIQRFYFWKSAAKIIKDFPFTGVGPGNFGLIYPQYKSPQAIETHFAHNSYLQVWAEMGILGILAWLWLILKSFQAGLRNLKASGGQNHLTNYLTIGLLAASSGFLAHNLIDFDFFLPELTFHWWTMLGLLILGQGPFYHHLPHSKPKN